MFHPISALKNKSTGNFRVAPIAIGLGIVSVLMLAFATSGALSGFTASINNSANTIGSGTLLMSENQNATTCLSSASGTVTVANAGTCATINKFGGSTTALPGASFTSTITIQNTGTSPANTFTLTPAGCTALPNGSINGSDTAGYCGKINITIFDGTNSKCVYPATAGACPTISSANNLTTLGTTPLALAVPVSPGASRSYTFTVQLDAATATNGDQGLMANEPLLWSFAS
jgi:hypothetical protein